MLDAIQTLTTENEGKSFEVPESRIGCAADARTVVSTLVRAEETRSKRRAKINGLLNGNPPWPRYMKEIGQGERANFNQREGEGFVAAAKTPYYDLENEVDRFAQFTLDYGDDPSKLNEWQDKIATRYHYALDDWDGRDMVVQRSQYQMIVHGVGPRVWEDATDWRSKSRMAGQILVPDDASADVEEWETFSVPRSYLPADLYEQIKNEGVATAAKWNVPAVKLAIMKAAPEEMQKTWGRTWEFYESEIRKGSAGWNAKSKRIFVQALFQKEFTNKWSHFIIAEPSIESADPEEAGDDEMKGFLYRKLNRFKCASEIICPFLYDVGPDGQWHSVKGAGPKIFDFCSISDRLTCKMVDGANVASGVLLRAKDAKALSQTAITHISGAVVMHPDYEIQQNRVADNLQSPLLVKRDLADTLSRNTGQYRARYDTERQAPTLGQAQMTASEQAILTKGDVNRYYRYLDKWHRETFRRILAMGKKLFASRKDVAPTEDYDDSRLNSSEKSALKFYRGLVEQDMVPEEVLEFRNFCRIKATRSIGHGSQQMKLMIGQQLLQLLPTMDERARNYALRLNASNLGGTNLADALYPRYDMPLADDDQMALATLENNALRVPGGQVIVTPSQDHVVHFGVHMNDVAQHAQMVQQGQDNPINLLVHLEQAGPHTYQHLQAVANDPTREAQVEQMNKAWLDMSKMTDQLAQQVTEAQAAAQAQQPQQAPDPALISALAKVNGELGIKKMKMLGDMKLKADKQAFTLRQKDIQTAHDMRLKTFEAVQPEKAA